MADAVLDHRINRAHRVDLKALTAPGSYRQLKLHCMAARAPRNSDRRRNIDQHSNDASA